MSGAENPQILLTPCLVHPWAAQNSLSRAHRFAQSIHLSGSSALTAGAWRPSAGRLRIGTERAGSTVATIARKVVRCMSLNVTKVFVGFEGLRARWLVMNLCSEAFSGRFLYSASSDIPSVLLQLGGIV